MIDLDAILRFAAAFALVIGLIALLAFGAKRWRGFGAKSGIAGRRLEVVAAIGVDAKRRAVILRADGEEHVLLIGGAADLHLATRKTGKADGHEA